MMILLFDYLINYNVESYFTQVDVLHVPHRAGHVAFSPTFSQNVALPLRSASQGTGGSRFPSPQSGVVVVVLVAMRVVLVLASVVSE